MASVLASQNISTFKSEYVMVQNQNDLQWEAKMYNQDYSKSQNGSIMFDYKTIPAANSDVVKKRSIGRLVAIGAFWGGVTGMVFGAQIGSRTDLPTLGSMIITGGLGAAAGALGGLLIHGISRS